MIVPGKQQIWTKSRILDSLFVMSFQNIQLRELCLEGICSYCTHALSESIYLIPLSQIVICFNCKLQFSFNTLAELPIDCLYLFFFCHKFTKRTNEKTLTHWCGCVYVHLRCFNLLLLLVLTAEEYLKK